MNCSNDGSNFSLAQKGAENTDVITKEVDKRNTKSSLHFTFVYKRKPTLLPSRLSFIRGITCDQQIFTAILPSVYPLNVTLFHGF